VGPDAGARDAEVRDLSAAADGAAADMAPADAAPEEDGAVREDGAAGTDGAAGSDGGAIDAGLEACALALACDGPPPAFAPNRGWRHTASRITAALGGPRHRGRDLYLREGETQWALAKFAYGANDDDIKDEDVDVWVQVGCAGEWRNVATRRTTRDGDHPAVGLVRDTGGRVFLDLATVGVTLPLGRHRIVFDVRGDDTWTDQVIEVLPPTARFVVTDVDGTQTESETAEWTALVGIPGPAAQPSGAALLTEFARRGYRVFYLTARPEWLDTRTHEWLAENGYPPGVVHTTLTFTGALGSAALAFKRDELAALAASFPGAPEYAIGNTDTDVAAFAGAGVPIERAWSYRYDGDGVATRVDDYATKILEVRALPTRCD
jgi:hypothetical protein